MAGGTTAADRASPGQRGAARARSNSAHWPTPSHNWRGWLDRTVPSSGTTNVGTTTLARRRNRWWDGVGNRSTTPPNCLECWPNSKLTSPAASRGRTLSRCVATMVPCAGTCRAPAVRDDRGQIVRWFGTNTDITDRIEMEATLKAGGPPQGRVPGHARPRAAQPARAHPQRRCTSSQWPRPPRIVTVTGHGDDGAAGARTSSAWWTTCWTCRRITRGKIEAARGAGRPGRRRRRGPSRRAGPLIDAQAPRADLDAVRRAAVVEADPTRLAQVIANLLNNAAKYTERGRAHPAEAEREGGEAVVRVRDTGMGIARRPAAARLRPVHAGRPVARPLAGRPRHRPDAGQEPGGDARRQRRGATATAPARAASLSCACP